ncbi:BrnT family toxin [Marivirga sericea]
MRYLLVGKINDVFWSAIFTFRNDKVRIISVRKSRENEKDIYKSI